jgi:N-acetylmuramoyl-L-alanine amidase
VAPRFTPAVSGRPGIAGNRFSSGARPFSARNFSGRTAAFAFGSFHPEWDRSRNYFWNHHHWRCYDGVWAVIDAGWPVYGFPYPYYYGGQVYPPAYAANDDTGNSLATSVQSALANDGYYNGPIDGDIGPQTQNAIADYQRDRGLAVTGSINTPLLNSLGLQ